MQLSQVLTEEQHELVETAAEMLYGLIHVRYILTSRGMAAMHEKFKAFEFGRCPRVLCQGQACLPVGTVDIPRQATVKIFCPRVQLLIVLLNYSYSMVETQNQDYYSWTQRSPSYISVLKAVTPAVENPAACEICIKPQIYSCLVPHQPCKNNLICCFQPQCQDIYCPRSKYQDNIDGAFFGTTFPHLLLMTYPSLAPPRLLRDLHAAGTNLKL